MPLSAPLNEFAVATAPGVEIRCYDTGGSGPAVVILHGLAGSAREFFPTAAALPEFRTLLMDLRGHGGSTRHPGDLSRGAYVADVVRVIEETAARPVTLVGSRWAAIRRCWRQKPVRIWWPGSSCWKRMPAPGTPKIMQRWGSTSGPGLSRFPAGRLRVHSLAAHPWRKRGLPTLKNVGTVSGRGSTPV
ncbi:hypothetical protein QFZ30_000380 [Arthrobacter pascens]|uniref:alpha/beta fold hydrolase n=1 Tax=Arthrobacter pascens TaxID=1677 RepID=UPI00278CDB57|nr:alpha/beta hydrolase [Arthrobacter pascens]MDQ0676998.1 hypothetical protein [Arthrobacter pascens]